MRTIALLFLGVVVGWAASGVDWSREAFAQEAPRRGAERSIRRERDGALRRRVLPPREAEAPTPATEAPAFDPNSSGEPGPSPGMEELAEPIVVPTPAAVSASPLPGRFQVSAYGSASGHGCYVVDTATGQMWHIANGQPPQVVASGLTPYAPQPAPAPAPLLSPPPMLSAPNAPTVIPQPSTDAAD